MSAGRERMLGAIRAALGRGPLLGDAAEALDARMADPRPGPLPARGQVDGEQRIDLFLTEAERVNATTERIAHRSLIPARVGAFLRDRNQPLEIRCAPDPALEQIPWDSEPALAVSYGAGRADDRAVLTGAFAGVAETGTLMLLSGPYAPTTLNFLPTDHIVVIDRDRIVGTYEDAWARVRAVAGSGTLPRAVNWITGPSRTADIEQTLLLGAHGPRNLHIILVDAAAA